MENKDSFNYTYCAKEQEEIKNIRNKYTAKEIKEEDKLTQLRRLDAKVTSKATTAALILGITGALILGSGMSLFMTDIADFLGTFLAMFMGIIIGIAGIILVILAYPIYNRTIKKNVKKSLPKSSALQMS